MSDFLMKLYEEEQEKTASADVEELMQHLSAEDLEEVLGIKTAGISGPAEAPLPTGKGHETVDKTKDKKIEPEKEKVEKEKQAAIHWADQTGRLLAHMHLEKLGFEGAQRTSKEVIKRALSKAGKKATREGTFSEMAEKALQRLKIGKSRRQMEAGAQAFRKKTAQAEGEEGKEGPMEKEEEFTTPEQKAKASVMRKVMKGSARMAKQAAEEGKGGKGFWERHKGKFLGPAIGAAAGYGIGGLVGHGVGRKIGKSKRFARFVAEKGEGMPVGEAAKGVKRLTQALGSAKGSGTGAAAGMTAGALRDLRAKKKRMEKKGEAKKDRISFFDRHKG